MCEACECKEYLQNQWNQKDEICRTCYHHLERHRKTTRRLSDEWSPVTLTPVSRNITTPGKFAQQRGKSECPPETTTDRPSSERGAQALSPPTLPPRPASTRPNMITPNFQVSSIQGAKSPSVPPRPTPLSPRNNLPPNSTTSDTHVSYNFQSNTSGGRTNDANSARPLSPRHQAGSSNTQGMLSPRRPEYCAKIVDSSKPHLQENATANPEKSMHQINTPTSRRLAPTRNVKSGAEQTECVIGQEYHGAGTSGLASPMIKGRARAPSIPLERPPAAHPAEPSPLSSSEISDPEMKKKMRRGMIVDEILKTEETYVKDMSLMLETFRNPLIDQKLISSEQLEALFGNAVALEQLHRQLLEKLRFRVTTAGQSAEATIGDSFIDLLPFMKLYTAYVNTYNEGTMLGLKLMEENKRFKDFLDANGGRLRLDALRVEPVQRIPRYVLLLTDLLKHTPMSHPDYATLSRAATEIEAIALSINEKKRSNENRVRIEGLSRVLKGNRRAMRESFRPGDELQVKHRWIKTKLSKPTFCGYCDKLLIPSILGREEKKYMECQVCGVICHLDDHRELPVNCGEKETLLKPGRWYIQEAKVKHFKVQLNRVKKGKATNVPQDCVLILFNDSIVITYPNEMGEPDIIDSMVRWSSRTSGRDMALADSRDTSFTITSPREAEVHTIITATLEEKNDWMTAIQQQMETWRKTQAEKKSTTAKTPVISRASMHRKPMEMKGQPASQSRNRLRFTIGSTVPVKNHGQKSFIAYVVDITDVEGNTKTLIKRYRDFHSLHNRLRESYGAKELPKMPGKRILGDNLDPLFIQRRCRRLEDYLNTISYNEEMMQLPCVLEFGATSLGMSQGEKRQSRVNVSGLKPKSTSPTLTKLVFQEDDEDLDDEDEEGLEEDEEYSSDEDAEKIIDKGEKSVTISYDDHRLLPVPKIVDADKMQSHKKAKAVWDYSSDRREGVLNLTENEVVWVLAESNDQWWYIQKESGETGWAPRMYLKFV